MKVNGHMVYHLITMPQPQAVDASRPQGYKTFSMLNSAEHDTLNAHKYKNVKKLSIFQAHISQECYFSCS